MSNGILSLIYPGKCVVCGKIMPDAKDSEALCTDCRLKYDVMCEDKCGNCGKRQNECRCKNAVGADIEVHLFEFAGEMSRKLIYTLKRKNNRHLHAFLSEQAAGAIEKALGICGGTAGCVVTFVPRNPDSVKDFGFDQSLILARRIAKLLGIPFVTLFEHKKHMKTQKELSAQERMENAQVSFSGKRGAISPKRVIIIDDVTTTGSTLTRCIALARGLGAEQVVTLTIAMTAKKL